MAPFRFSLQKVLELRERSELETARGLAEARRAAEAAETARADLDAARAAGRERLASVHRAGGSVGHLRNLAELIGRLDEDVREAETSCRAADEAVVRSMESFREAVRERRAIDRVRERRLERWRVEEARNETRAMDEVARRGAATVEHDAREPEA